jgi:cytochrome c biogenesis protein CcmG/thiol:disulfide interchange protein DsbE
VSRAAIAIAALLGASACGPPPMPASVGHPLSGATAPEFHEMATNSWDVGLPGGPRTKVTVVDFWASWCEACQLSLPALEKLWHDRQDDGVMVIGVSVDKTTEDATSRLNELHATFPVVVDPRMNIAGRYRVAQIPLTFVIDGHGAVRWVGRDPGEMRQAVEAVLGER